MSQANVEVVVKQFEGANARDFAGVMDAWAEDVSSYFTGMLARSMTRRPGRWPSQSGSGTGSGGSARTTGSTSMKRTTPVTVSWSSPPTTGTGGAAG